MGNQLCNQVSAAKEKEIPGLGDFSVSNFQHYYAEDNIEKVNSLAPQVTGKTQLLQPIVASRNLFGESVRREEHTKLKMSHKKFGKKSKQLKESSNYHLNPITFSTFCSIEEVGVQSQDHQYSHSWLSLEGSLPNYKEEQQQSEKGVSCIYDYFADWIKQEIEVDITKEQFIRIRKVDIAKDYLLKERLGEGAFGQVFKCQSIHSGAERAVKVLKSNILVNPKVKQQFLQQFSLLKRIDHPNIVKIYEIYQQPTCMYIVTELCHGGTLSNLMKSHPILPEHLVKAILLQLFQAVAYLHGQKILHRDIKPDNVVFVHSLSATSSAEDVDIRLIDFGLALQEKEKIFRDWAQIGTRSYMAPQVYSGIYSRKCDAWSCGVIMHMLMLGFNPFKVDAIDQRQPRHYHPDSHGSRWQDLTHQQKSILLSLLEKNYATRMDVVHALKHPYFSALPIIPDIDVVNKLYRYSRGNNLVAAVQGYLSLITTSQENSHNSAAIFRSIDVDQDGIIKRHQLNAYLCSAGLESEQADYVFRKLDKNHSGGIDFGELLIALQQRKNLFTSSKLLEAFRYIDLNHNGTLEKQELKFFLRSLDKKQIDQLLKQIEKTGKVNFTAFQSYLQQERWL